MPVKAASNLVARAMRVAIKEAMSPANQGTESSPKSGTLVEAGKVSRVFGHELHQQSNAYTGSVDEFGCPGNTVDSWRLEFSKTGNGFEAANGTNSLKRRQG